MLRRLGPGDVDRVAAIHRAAFDERCPWLAGRHTPAEDRAFFGDRVFQDCAVWGAVEDEVVGFVAFREGWVDQLHVLPGWQRRGLGGALLAVAQATWPRLRLWTFGRNEAARRFYEARGFVALEETDGSGNEEREPDVLYGWHDAA